MVREERGKFLPFSRKRGCAGGTLMEVELNTKFLDDQIARRRWRLKLQVSQKYRTRRFCEVACGRGFDLAHLAQLKNGIMNANYKMELGL